MKLSGSGKSAPQPSRNTGGGSRRELLQEHLPLAVLELDAHAQMLAPERLHLLRHELVRLVAVEDDAHGRRASPDRRLPRASSARARSGSKPRPSVGFACGMPGGIHDGHGLLAAAQQRRELRAVDRERERAAHARVVERRLAHVEAVVVAAQQRLAQVLGARFVAADLERRELHQIEQALLPQHERRAVLLDHVGGDPVERRVAPPSSARSRAARADTRGATPRARTDRA